METFCKETAAKLGLDYVDANHKNYLIRKIVWDRPGVEEWVRTIAEAELVITPSFHGLAFSLIYHRQFVIVLSPEGKNVARVLPACWCSWALRTAFSQVWKTL